VVRWLKFYKHDTSRGEIAMQSMKFTLIAAVMTAALLVAAIAGTALAG
jgi:hypothetical protein